MKKPVPRDCPAVIDATAGKMRLTTSSRASGGLVVVQSKTVGAGGGSMGAGSSTAIGCEVDMGGSRGARRGPSRPARRGGCGAAEEKQGDDGGPDESQDGEEKQQMCAGLLRRRCGLRLVDRGLVRRRRVGADTASAFADTSWHAASAGGAPQERFAETGCSMKHRGDRAARTPASVYGLSGNSPRSFR